MSMIRGLQLPRLPLLTGYTECHISVMCVGRYGSFEMAHLPMHGVLATDALEMK